MIRGEVREAIGVAIKSANVIKELQNQEFKLFPEASCKAIFNSGVSEFVRSIKWENISFKFDNAGEVVLSVEGISFLVDSFCGFAKENLARTYRIGFDRSDKVLSFLNDLNDDLILELSKLQIKM